MQIQGEIIGKQLYLYNRDASGLDYIMVTYDAAKDELFMSGAKCTKQ